ncbi:hypothetical protein sphantq_04519 (plasmid) [Sphingobium sp. AntQ-1]|uniref:helix-turn-helix domain-containing protein n=1 Tax=Sphingobium sp. AntQ-1 TaxID=2930091 RepID=UPI00234E7F12|nr:helix-turn-helix domain-containing protein [Sphingobium sp. AntQ-1]WCP16025.1 hypothetical protein sphantq_04519 [Sphingobium sp. AntQ-1]
MITSARGLGHLLDAEATVSFATVADLLRLATRCRSRKLIVDWCEALADELDWFEENAPTQNICARMSLQHNLNLRRPAASLLQKLASAPDCLHRREDLVDAIDTTPGALKVYVWEIRNSFEAAGLDDPLETVWGEGYILTAVGAASVKRASRRILKADQANSVGNSSKTALLQAVET